MRPRCHSWMSAPRLSDPGGGGCTLAGCASFALPFCAIFARRELNAPEDTAGIYLVCATAAAVLSNLVLGLVSGRRGNRSVIRLAAATAVLPMTVALLVASVPDLGPDTGVNKSLISALVFAFVGLHATASSIGNMNSCWNWRRPRTGLFTSDLPMAWSAWRSLRHRSAAPLWIRWALCCCFVLRWRAAWWLWPFNEAGRTTQKGCQCR